MGGTPPCHEAMHHSLRCNRMRTLVRWVKAFSFHSCSKRYRHRSDCSNSIVIFHSILIPRVFPPSFRIIPHPHLGPASAGPSATLLTLIRSMSSNSVSWCGCPDLPSIHLSYNLPHSFRTIPPSAPGAGISWLPSRSMSFRFVPWCG